MSEQELKQLFDNEFDCCTIFSAKIGKTEEAIAMTKDKFVEVVFKLQQANEANKQPDTKALALNSVIACFLKDKAKQYDVNVEDLEICLIDDKLELYKEYEIDDRPRGYALLEEIK